MLLQSHVIVLVLAAAVMHAGWNALIKKGEDRLLTLAFVIGGGAAAAFLALPFVTPPAPESWVYLGLSMVTHVGYFFFLLQAYRVGDLSHVYPIARGAAPLMVAAGAAVFAGETLGPLAVVGLVLASAAIASLAFERGDVIADHDVRPVLYALATGGFIAAYTVIDGLGVRASGNAIGYILWLFFLDGMPMVGYALWVRRGAVLPYFRTYWRQGLGGSVLATLAYGVVIWALGEGAMAAVSALRETSVVFAAVIGSVMLGEPFGRPRVIAAALVAAGIATLHLAG
jgi:drug/metabolite transporter (DMT)-like permease